VVQYRTSDDGIKASVGQAELHGVLHGERDYGPGALARDAAFRLPQQVGGQVDGHEATDHRPQATCELARSTADF
jgi:hypothetical protein